MTVELVGVDARVEGVSAAVSEGEREALISDKLSSLLGIQLIDIGGGIWRHKDGEPGVERPSAKLEYW